MPSAAASELREEEREDLSENAADEPVGKPHAQPRAKPLSCGRTASDGAARVSQVSEEILQAETLLLQFRPSHGTSGMAQVRQARELTDELRGLRHQLQPRSDGSSCPKPLLESLVAQLRRIFCDMHALMSAAAEERRAKKAAGASTGSGGSAGSGQEADAASLGATEVAKCGEADAQEFQERVERPPEGDHQTEADSAESPEVGLVGAKIKHINNSTEPSGHDDQSSANDGAPATPLPSPSAQFDFLGSDLKAALKGALREAASGENGGTTPDIELVLVADAGTASVDAVEDEGPSSSSPVRSFRFESGQKVRKQLQNIVWCHRFSTG